MQTFIFRIIPVKKVYITVAIYTILFVVIAFVMYKYIPIMINQVITIIDQIVDFDFNYSDNRILNYGFQIVKDIDIANNLKSGSDYLLGLATNAGKISFNIFISLILSLFFILEKEEISNFLRKFEKSKARGAYQYIKYFGKNFLNSFGKVMKAQILIATINAILSVVALRFMGFHQLLGLGLMIFLLGLIPVAGVIISLIPLAIIAFKIGGIMKVLAVLIMVTVLHGLEGYVLNPKFMSVNTKLPVFFTFVILLVSEHYMGIWGLLLGIPLFMFVLDLLDVNVVEEKRSIKR
jgi:predicted PurR-regulated permease PerM